LSNLNLSFSFTTALSSRVFLFNKNLIFVKVV